MFYGTWLNSFFSPENIIYSLLVFFSTIISVFKMINIFTNTLYEPSITELDAVLLVSVCNSLGSRANWKSCCPRAVALAMCWSAVCSAPVCCNGMVFTLGLQGFVRSCIETGLSVSIYIVYWRCNSYLKWTWVMGKVYSIYLSYKFFSCWCCLR